MPEQGAGCAGDNAVSAEQALAGTEINLGVSTAAPLQNVRGAGRDAVTTAVATRHERRFRQRPGRTQGSTAPGEISAQELHSTDGGTHSIPIITLEECNFAKRNATAP